MCDPVILRSLDDISEQAKTHWPKEYAKQLRTKWLKRIGMKETAIITGLAKIITI